ncbi:uncharacterized protein ARMOST_03153 [Armillaria ostoyae]|uniref:Uncharacterized protein n=1 Tax=Armillaria ostoyae TaxID=47428 RepID=A0A284QTN8_ARMOS|nr:uncharacterized protein ARMOST_03153 [Armillaria ostoyae]
MDALDEGSDVDVTLVHEMLLNSVISYLIEMDTESTSPTDVDLNHEDKDLVEMLDYLVAKAALHLDPIPEDDKLVDNEVDGKTDSSGDIETWCCEVESSCDDELDLDIVPLLLCSPPYGEWDDGEPVINIWDVSLKHGLTLIEPPQPWDERDEEELERPPPMQLLPFIPRESIEPEAQRGLWFYSELSNDYPHSFEEKFSFINSYGCKESCHPCSFGDTVAQNVQ